jgi:hypothetical protein
MIRRMSRYVCPLLVGLMLAMPAARAEPCGSHEQDPIATDRPQITNSSIVVPCGSLQFENGFLATTPNGGQRGFDFPETGIRFGISGKTELRMSAPDYFYNNDTYSGYANGWGDLTLGFKQQFGPTQGFDVSFIGSASFPIGANRISSHGYDPALQLPWSHSLPKNWTVAGMFSVMWPTELGRRNATGQSSVYFDRQLTKPWDAYAEYSGSFPQRGGPQHLINFGTAYKLSSHQQLDLHWNLGLSSAAPDYSIGFGYSFRFQVIRAVGHP